MDKNIENLFDRLKDMGISLLGVSRVEGIPQAKGYPFAITMGCRLSDSVLSEIEGAPTFEYFHHYRTVNTFLDQSALFAATAIQRLGYNAHPIAASQSSNTDPYQSAFPHKTAATLAGLGWIGKSALFVSNDYGSRVRLVTVLTDYPMGVENVLAPNGCADCNICVKACPAGAIVGSNYETGAARESIFEAEKCSRYMKQAFQNIGRGSVCGICIKVCPYNNLQK